MCAQTTDGVVELNDTDLELQHAQSLRQAVNGYPNGNVTYWVYNDPDHEVFTYVGWNTTTDRPTGPTEVTRQDWADGYDERSPCP